MAYKPTLEDLPPESPITFQPTVADLPPTHPILSELGSVLRGIVGIPGQLARETVGTVMGLRHPLRTAQDIGEGLRAVIQNQLAPAGLDILKIAQYPVQEIAQKVAPEDVVTQAGRQFRGVQIPPYTPTHPQDPATQLARFVGTAIPVGRGAMAVERGVGLLGESLPAFLGRRA
ncbi:MAG: hypothetical protein GWN62_34770, partial [Aliifodinibius sp.]|nr:hypothetical protein [Fodinibius sp.]